MTSYRIVISVVGADPAVTRTIGLPKGSTLGDLSRAIQAVLGWGDYRPHLFHIPSKGETAQPGEAVPEESILCEEDVSLWTHRVPMTYVYGFEPRWEVSVSFGKQSKDGLKHPVLIDSQGEAPLEDCAGIEAWNDILRILADPDHPDHGDVSAWVDEERGYDETNPAMAEERLSEIERPSEDEGQPTVRDPRAGDRWFNEADPSSLKHLDGTARSDARRISRMHIPCPRCGEQCVPVLDTDGEPVSIAGKGHYPIRISCSCGEVTGLSLLNDGYVVGYTYTGMAHPYPMCAHYDALRRDLRAERNPLRRGRLLIAFSRECVLLDAVDGAIDGIDEAVRLGGSRDPGLSSTARMDEMYITGSPVSGSVLLSALDAVSAELYRLMLPAHSLNEAVEDRGKVERALSSSDVPLWIRRRLLQRAIGRIDEAGGHDEAVMMRTEAIRDLIGEAKGPDADTEVYRRLASTVSDLCAGCYRNGSIEAAAEGLGLYYAAFDPGSKHPSAFLQVDARVRMGLYRMTVRNDRKGAQRDLEAALDLARRNPGMLALERSAVASSLLAILGRNVSDNIDWTVAVVTHLLGHQMVSLEAGTEALLLMNTAMEEKDAFMDPLMRMIRGPEDEDDGVLGRIRGAPDAWGISFMTRTGAQERRPEPMHSYRPPRWAHPCLTETSRRRRTASGRSWSRSPWPPSGEAPGSSSSTGPV